MINGIDSPYKGSGGLTREQFLFHETRVVARLMTDENLSDQEIIDRVVSENLFQFPTRPEYTRQGSGHSHRMEAFAES